MWSDDIVWGGIDPASFLQNGSFCTILKERSLLRVNKLLAQVLQDLEARNFNQACSSELVPRACDRACAERVRAISKMERGRMQARSRFWRQCFSTRQSQSNSTTDTADDIERIPNQLHCTTSQSSWFGLQKEHVDKTFLRIREEGLRRKGEIAARGAGQPNERQSFRDNGGFRYRSLWISTAAPRFISRGEFVAAQE